jgi:hypothetical protein
MENLSGGKNFSVVTEKLFRRRAVKIIPSKTGIVLLNV